ncbi:hypothetical protein BSPWISOXPB_6830 [uncultured Gammaproteobacteria bacterium]|nr:hypothetical protein BSPWISOXPB_6830 [uncultured Gammaproteobacteria bacterium]
MVGTHHHHHHVSVDHTMNGDISVDLKPIKRTTGHQSSAFVEDLIQLAPHSADMGIWSLYKIFRYITR